MARVEVRPATREDFIEFAGTVPKFRSRCFVGRVDGKIVGVGGVVYLPDGRTGAALVLTPQARETLKLSTHKCGVMFMRWAEREGFAELWADAGPESAAADRWLQRLGFEKTTVNGKILYRWVRGSSPQAR